MAKKTLKKRTIKKTTTRQEIVEYYKAINEEEGVAGLSRPQRQRRRLAYLKDFKIYEDW